MAAIGDCAEHPEFRGRYAAFAVSIDVSSTNGHHAQGIELLKPSEVAAQLGVSRTWLYDAARRGRIPSIRIGGEEGPLRFAVEDLQRWIDGARARWRPGSPACATRSTLRGRFGPHSRPLAPAAAPLAVRSGERMLRRQQVAGSVRITDRPADGQGRSYLVERELAQDGEQAVHAIVVDYLDRARRLDRVPMSIAGR